MFQDDGDEDISDITGKFCLRLLNVYECNINNKDNKRSLVIIIKLDCSIKFYYAFRFNKGISVLIKFKRGRFKTVILCSPF